MSSSNIFLPSEISNVILHCNIQYENKESNNTSNFSGDVQSLVNDGRNKCPVTCVRCPSKILGAAAGECKEIKRPLPLMKSRKNTADILEKETLNQCWMVKDKFTFENIGFSNTVSEIKYLICADCEIGPTGWFDPTSQLSYVSVSRVKYQF